MKNCWIILLYLSALVRSLLDKVRRDVVGVLRSYGQMMAVARELFDMLRWRGYEDVVYHCL